MFGYSTWLKSSSNPSNHIVDWSYLTVCVDVHPQLPETDIKTKVGTKEKIVEQFYILRSNLLISFYYILSYSDMPGTAVCLSVCLSDDLLAFKIISESWTNSIRYIQSSFPVVGWNLPSHVPDKWKKNSHAAEFN